MICVVRISKIEDVDKWKFWIVGLVCWVYIWVVYLDLWFLVVFFFVILFCIRYDFCCFVGDDLDRYFLLYCLISEGVYW